MESSISSVSFRKKIPKANEILINRSKSLRSNSTSSLDILLKCALCLQIMDNPKMLPCQHTFCLNCLKAKQKSGTDKEDAAGQLFKCPHCDFLISEALEQLPTNLYIESLRKLLENEEEAAEKTKCSKCQTMQLVKNMQNCQHCAEFFCNICFDHHLEELTDVVANLTKQIDSRKITSNLEKSLQNLAAVESAVKMNFSQKIADLKRKESEILQEITFINDSLTNNADILADKLRELVKQTTSCQITKMDHFTEFYGKLAEIRQEIDSFATDSWQYDSGVQKIQHCPAVLPLIGENAYKNRKFVPKFEIRKSARFCGINSPKWNQNLLYVTNPNRQTIYILNTDSNHLEQSHILEQSQYPCAVTFYEDKRQIFVVDKWQHCIHQCSEDMTHMGRLCHNEVRLPSDAKINKNLLYIADCGNNRIAIATIDSGQIVQTIDNLNKPMSLDVYDQKLIVADSGNHRIKFFELSGQFLTEFGSFGKNPGQFKQAVAVSVDRSGNIVVGDAGNSRLQVFGPKGNLLQVFKNDSALKWISGVFVATGGDIFITDHINRHFVRF